MEAIKLPVGFRMSVNYNSEGATCDLYYNGKSVAYCHSTNFVRFASLRDGVQCEKFSDAIELIIKYANDGVIK